MVSDLPSIPFNFDAIPDPKDRFLKTMKMRVMVEMIKKQNVAVWAPAVKRMYFSLPKDMTVPESEMEFMMVSIPIPKKDSEDTQGDELIMESINKDGQFDFSNKTWDAIEYELEHGGEDEGKSGKRERENAHIFESFLHFCHTFFHSYVKVRHYTLSNNLAIVWHIISM
jgi:hypothetical protein